HQHNWADVVNANDNIFRRALVSWQANSTTDVGVGAPVVAGGAGGGGDDDAWGILFSSSNAREGLYTYPNDGQVETDIGWNNGQGSYLGTGDLFMNLWNGHQYEHVHSFNVNNLNSTSYQNDHGHGHSISANIAPWNNRPAYITTVYLIRIK
ncbi:MAG: hypothetical protein DRI57_26650, partial [Deltaproteobacteria bacterium]